MRAMITAPGAPRVGLPCPGQRVRHTPLAPATRGHLRPRGRRSRSGITPMAMFSRYDPFGIPPPYRSSSGQWGAGSGSNSRMSGEQRLSAASPAQRQAMLSSAISAVTDWPQLWSIVERYGRYLTANNVTHALTKLEQLVQGQQYRPAEASQIEDLLEWLLQRGRELNATAQLGPQALGATAGAVSRLQQAQRQQQQQQEAAAQQQRQQQQQQGVAQSEAAAKLQRQQQAAAVERDQLMRELVDAAVSQKHRLSPQALNNLLSALAEIEESDMSADDIRQLLHLPTKTKQAPSPAAPQSAAPTQRQQQQQQQAQPVSSSNTSRPVSPGSLQATARQLGQLSPELAEEWYDRALRQDLEQGYIPAGIDQSYISGFLAREIQRAAARAASSEGSGAVLLSSTVSKYSQLLGVDHLALALHKLADLQQQEAAGSDQEVKAAAGSFFKRLQPLVAEADGATLASLVSSCKDLQLYSKTLLQPCLARAEILLEQQLQGFVSQQAGFSGRRLGVLLHSLAVLGLKPSTNWLRLAVTAAGEVLSGCSIIDLERLASALLIMRVDPGRQWVTAAEAQLERIAAALGSGDSRRLPHAGKEELLDNEEEEDEEGTGNARRALVACVKALALFGGQRARGWYQSILAAEEQQQRLEQQQQQLTEAELRRRQAEYEQQQASLKAAQQQQQQPDAGSAAAGGQAVERQLQKAVQQQHRGPKLHLHPHHHLQHRHPAAKQQQQQQAQQPSSGGRSELGPLSSLDDLMSQQLAMQQGGQQQGPLGPDSKLPQSRTPLSGPESNSAAAAAAAEVEAAAPAAWANEQASRWAQSRGEAGQPSPAAEVQQRLDDSQKLFGGSTSSSRRGKGGSSAAGQQQAGGAAQQKSPQAKVGQGSTAGSSSSAGSKGGSRPQESSSAAAASAGRPAAPREVPVKFDAGSSSSSSSSGHRSVGDSRPLSRQAQRSAAEAADALAALMAEIDGQAVSESDQEEVLKELGLTDGPDSLAESKVQAAELQEAADRVKQATQQLDELQKQQRSASTTADVGPGREQHTGGASKRHKHDKKQQQHKQSARAADSKKAAPKRPLGSSGEPAFVAAAKALQGPKKPSRNFLLGCLEAIEQQQEQLKIKLAEKQALSAVAGAAARQRKAAAAAQDPAARQLQQLTADFDRARERAEAEKSGIRATAAADVLSRLLPLLDSFEAAEAALDQQQRQQGSAGNEREYEDARRVYNALHAQLLSIIKSQGARVLGQDGDLEGKPFDPAEMEAVMRQPAPAGFGDGEVLKVLRKGYAIGDKLVRPALVVVAYED